MKKPQTILIRSSQQQNGSGVDVDYWIPFFPFGVKFCQGGATKGWYLTCYRRNFGHRTTFLILPFTKTFNLCLRKTS